MDNPSGLSIFDLLVWAGIFLSLVGLCGLVWCILFIARARRAKPTEEELREKLRKALPLNLGALFVSVFGLMLVVIGIFLR